MKSLRPTVLLLLIGLWSLFATAGQAQDEWLRLEPLLQEARQSNPDVQSLEQAWEAARARIPQAGALPDPTISFNLLNVPIKTLDFDQEAMTGKQVMFMQMFPFPGKLGLKTRISEQDAAVAQAQYQEGLNQVLTRVKELYYQIFFVDKALETVGKTLDVLKEFIGIAETKYRVGSGLQQDVLRAQVEHSRLLDKQLQLVQRRLSLVAQMNALLNRPAESPLGKPRTPDFRPFPFSADTLKAMAEQSRPLLFAWRARAEKTRHMVHLARKEYLPDFRVGVGYTQRDRLRNGGIGADFITALVTVDVPLYWWRKQKKQVQEVRYREKQIAQKYLDVRNQVLAGIESVYNDLVKSAERVTLFEQGILSQANQSLESAIAGYQTDKVDFITLLNNEINLFNFELDYYRAISDYHIDIARLELLTGRDLFEHEIESGEEK